MALPGPRPAGADRRRRRRDAADHHPRGDPGDCPRGAAGARERRGRAARVVARDADDLPALRALARERPSGLTAQISNPTYLEITRSNDDDGVAWVLRVLVP
jgi:hypothetical protein